MKVLNENENGRKFDLIFTETAKFSEPISKDSGPKSVNMQHTAADRGRVVKRFQSNGEESGRVDLRAVQNSTSQLRVHWEIADGKDQ